MTGPRFIAGRSQVALDWIRDQLGVNPADVTEVVIKLNAHEVATAKVTVLLREGALARLPAVSVEQWEPDPLQVKAAAYAIGQASDCYMTPENLERTARAALKAAAPGNAGVDVTAVQDAEPRTVDP